MERERLQALDVSWGPVIFLAGRVCPQRADVRIVRSAFALSGAFGSQGTASPTLLFMQRAEKTMACVSTDVRSVGMRLNYPGCDRA